MWSFPTCEICERKINSLHRYKVEENVYLCPECMSDAMYRITKAVHQVVSDAVWNMTDDWMECNDPLFADYDPDLGFGSFKEE